MFRYFLVLACFLALAACGRQPDQTPPPPPTITFPTPMVTAITPAPMDTRPAPGEDVPDASARPIPPQPTPADLIGGDTVQEGPFTFFLWLFRDPRMNQQPAIPSLYSDLDGIGIYKSWVYQGPDVNGAVLTFTLQLGANGFEPMDIGVDVFH